MEAEEEDEKNDDNERDVVQLGSAPSRYEVMCLKKPGGIHQAPADLHHGIRSESNSEALRIDEKETLYKQAGTAASTRAARTTRRRTVSTTTATMPGHD
jgi:hypothetical protein